MKQGIPFTVLSRWLVANAVITICLGLFLALACLFPSCAPGLHTLLCGEAIAPLLPYIIFALIVSALVSISFYVDSRWR